MTVGKFILMRVVDGEIYNPSFHETVDEAREEMIEQFKSELYRTLSEKEADEIVAKISVNKTYDDGDLYVLNETSSFIYYEDSKNDWRIVNLESIVVKPCLICKRQVKISGGPEEWIPSFTDPDSGGEPYSISCECGLYFSKSSIDYSDFVIAWNTRHENETNVPTSEKLKELTLEELRKRDGETVYMRDLTLHQTFIDFELDDIKDYGKTWIAYDKA